MRIAGVAALVMLASPPGTSTTLQVISTDCISPTGQLCDPAIVRTFETHATLKIRFANHWGSCSDLRGLLSVDGGTPLTTAYLSPGEFSELYDFGPVSPGPHVIAVQAEGIVSGCNHGILYAWAGFLEVTTDAL